jgi:hypothetical protein
MVSASCLSDQLQSFHYVVGYYFYTFNSIFVQSEKKNSILVQLIKK